MEGLIYVAFDGLAVESLNIFEILSGSVLLTLLPVCPTDGPCLK